MSMINDRGDGDENGDENDDDNDDHGDSVIHFVGKSHSQSVSQSVILPSKYYQKWKQM